LTNFKKELEARGKKPSITISLFKQAYLKNILITHTKGSFVQSKRSIEKFTNYLMEDVLLSDITKAQAESFILGVYSRSKHTASLYLRNLKAAFNKAISWEHIEKNPFQGLKVVIEENYPVFIGVEELNRIVEKETNFMLASIFRFAFYTGLRISEIVNLGWSDIDWENKIISVKNKNDFILKSKRQRDLPLSNVVYEILYNIRRDTGIVFHNNEERFRKEYVSKKFKKSVRSACLNDAIHFHTLRHSFASNLASQGVNLFVIQKLLGHKDPSVTQKYSHLKIDDLVNAINKLN